MPNPFCQRKSHAVFSARNFVRVLLAVTLLAQVARGKEYVILTVFKGDYDGPCRILLRIGGEPITYDFGGFRSTVFLPWEEDQKIRLEIDRMNQAYPVTGLDFAVKWYSLSDPVEPDDLTVFWGRVKDTKTLWEEKGIKVPAGAVIERTVKLNLDHHEENALSGMQELTKEDVEGVKEAYLSYVRALGESSLDKYKKHFVNPDDIEMDELDAAYKFPKGKVINFAGKREVDVVLGKKVALVRLKEQQLDGEDALVWDVVKIRGDEIRDGDGYYRFSRRQDGKWVVWYGAWEPHVLKEVATKESVTGVRPQIISKVLGQIGQLKQGDGWDDFCKAAGLDRKDLEVVKGVGAHGVDTFLYRFVEHDGWLLQVLYKTPKEGQKDELLRIGVIKSDVDQARKAWPNLKLSIYPYYQNGKVVKEEQN
ncbi:hypothetical protein SAMN02745181_3738 [Rubritalea squalenifaciens DSM 18772]|uniref:Uncharacterized protein n=1 Tax=Rubritalea squalenifaciens DSM 18772 TaxID=1123071 RepID=A0A1M6S713_9BACT|nr:hypothetical protein [Rubritalea squalenifaciens]SHK40491.1 hypothetical protein SAMN02745181_3738 [Rubritalea squalenifaciens DSM 18772]